MYSVKLAQAQLACLIAVLPASGQSLGSEAFDFNRIRISDSRIFPVTENKRKAALSILNGNAFIKAQKADLSKIFPGKSFHPQSLVQKQVDEAIAWARQREKEAADPFFASSRDWMLKEATEHRRYADYSKSILRSQIPYLIDAVAYFEGTGGFTAILTGDELSVSHGSLGHSTPPIHKVPVLIFVERPITKVTTYATIAE